MINISLTFSFWISDEVKFWFFLFSHFENTRSSSARSFKNCLKLESLSFPSPHIGNPWRFLLDMLYFGFLLQLNYYLSFQKHLLLTLAVSLWVACWWKFQDSCWWKPLSVLHACFQLEYAVLMKEFFTLMSFNML